MAMSVSLVIDFNINQNALSFNFGICEGVKNFGRQ